MAVRPVDMDLLNELYDAGNLRCKFGQQLRDWGEETQNSVARALAAGVTADVVRNVLYNRGFTDIAGLKTIRLHLRRECRCPKRR